MVEQKQLPQQGGSARCALDAVEADDAAAAGCQTHDYSLDQIYEAKSFRMVFSRKISRSEPSYVMIVAYANFNQHKPRNIRLTSWDMRAGTPSQSPNLMSKDRFPQQQIG